MRLFQALLVPALSFAITQQSAGEWDDETIERDVTELTKRLMAANGSTPDEIEAVVFQFVREQSEGEWSEDDINDDATALTIVIMMTHAVLEKELAAMAPNSKG